MKASSQQTIAMVGLALFVVALILVTFFGIRFISSLNISGNASSGIYSFTERLGNSFSSAINGFKGMDERILMKTENMRLRARLAELEDVYQENAFLRNSAKLLPRNEYSTVLGGVFSYSISGQDVLITANVGLREGVVKNSVAITESGALLGFVRDVQKRSATIVVLGDPFLQVTGRIIGSQTSGLVRMDGSGRLILDLIGKDEVVNEGDVVVSSGLDNAPAGLIIGTVRSVDFEGTTLFQQISLDIAHKSESVFKALILVP